MHSLSILVCSYYLLLSIINVIYLKIRSKKAVTIKSEPFISVMIPARNEEANIQDCVESLMNQNYQNYEVLVIDDNSDDATYEILKTLETQHQNLRIFSGTDLPEGWYGKPWALQQLSHHARGKYFLFTDADTIHNSESLSFMATNMIHHKSDLISAIPKEEMKTFGELLTVPALYVMTSVIMPLPAIDLMKWKEASYCLGQYFCIKSETFHEMDGFNHVKHLITEDVAFGKEVKRRGYKTLFLDAQNYVNCRMYHGYIESFRGLGKNIYSSIGYNLVLFSFTALLIFITVNLPFGRFIYDLAAGSLSFYSALPTILFFTMWTVVSYYNKLPWYNPFLYPLQYGNLLIMATFYTVKFRTGPGVNWKGRIVK